MSTFTNFASSASGETKEIEVYEDFEAIDFTEGTSVFDLPVKEALLSEEKIVQYRIVDDFTASKDWVNYTDKIREITASDKKEYTVLAHDFSKNEFCMVKYNLKELIEHSFRSPYITIPNQNQKLGVGDSLAINISTVALPRIDGGVDYVLVISDIFNGRFMVPHIFWKTIRSFVDSGFTLSTFEGILKFNTIISNSYGTAESLLDIGVRHFWMLRNHIMLNMSSMAQFPENWIVDGVTDGACFTAIFGSCSRVGKNACCHGIYGDGAKCPFHNIYMIGVAGIWSARFEKKDCTHPFLHKTVSSVSGTPMSFCTSCNSLEIGEKVASMTAKTDARRHILGFPEFENETISLIKGKADQTPKKFDKPKSKTPCRFGKKCRNGSKCPFSHAG